MAKQIGMFDLPIKEKKSVRLDRIQVPLWTECKAKLIEKYLFLFVQVTKHGTYIDGFAGPQNEKETNKWSAKLVLDSEPKWFRNFYLFDESKTQYDCLISLKESCCLTDPQRNIQIKCGDFNTLVDAFLEENPIKEAAFCLLDQRTFECKWSTVEKIAKHKQKPYKIEIFYFLPNWWLNRSISALKDKNTKMTLWYGNENWEEIVDMKSWNRAIHYSDRFKKELDYTYVTPWPIYERRGGGKIMYFMIHASDHPEAPKFMRRAYNEAVIRLRDEEQLSIF